MDTSQGRVIKSHQVQGWENFHLGSWCRENLGVPAILGNDCDVATLAEANFGAGQGRRSVFFITVGTGVGGGFVHDGQLLGAGRPAACEIGHLRPGLHAVQPDQTVESLASGWGIAAAAQARLAGDVTGSLTSWEGLRSSRESRRASAALGRCETCRRGIDGRPVGALQPERRSTDGTHRRGGSRSRERHCPTRARTCLRSARLGHRPDRHAARPGSCRRGRWRLVDGRAAVLRAAAPGSRPLRVSAAAGQFHDRAGGVGRKRRGARRSLAAPAHGPRGREELPTAPGHRPWCRSPGGWLTTNLAACSAPTA